MSHLEPTYLRYIYDGLIKGSIHPENSAELPEGLIGLYEEAFDEKQPVHLRQQLLQRFAIWALLKKEVSAHFIAEVLNQSEDEIQEFIATYSAWFNSPKSGKYQLYHERLKVYLLQKLSEGEVHALHEKLISRLDRAIEEQKADEFEWYGLEFLTQHYAVNAMLNGDGSKLLDHAYNQNHWQRQLKISKGYIWTKSGLHSVMNWASKYNDDEVIECGLQLVDLHHQEQNAAPQIVALVAEGDFDAALKRIEQFGGNDKEGLQRKFILYMLCLMELTLLESKNKPFRIEGIEKLLKHLDEQLPVDHSVLNWSDFFSSILVFKICSNLEFLSLDFHPILKRTEDFDIDWVEANGPYNSGEFKVLDKILWNILDEEKRNESTKLILIELAKQNKIKEVNLLLRNVEIEIKDECTDLVSTALVSKGRVKKSIFYALKIKDATNKNACLYKIIDKLLERDKYSDAQEIFPFFTIRYYRVAAMCLLSNYLFKNKTGNHLTPLREAFKISNTIQNASWLLMSKRRIAAALIEQRKFSRAFKIIQETFTLDINNDGVKDFYLSRIIEFFSNSKKHDFALKVSEQIFDQSLRTKEMAKVMVLKKQLEEGFNLILKDFEGSEWQFQDFIIDLVENGEYITALEYCQLMHELDYLCYIALAYLEAGQIELIYDLLKAKCNVIWENPLKQLIQLLFEGYSIWMLDNILKIVRVQFGISESFEILHWIINTPELNLRSLPFKLIISNCNLQTQHDKINSTLLEQISFKFSTNNKGSILKKLTYDFYCHGSNDIAFNLLRHGISKKEQFEVINEILDYDLDHQYPSNNRKIIKKVVTPIIDEIALDDLNYKYSLAPIYLKINENRKLKDYLNSIPNSILKINNFIEIANLLNKKDALLISEKYVEFAVSEIEKLNDTEDKCAWFRILAEISSSNKNFENANRLLSKSISYLELCDEDSVGAEVYSISALLCEFEDFDRALELIEDLDEYWKIPSYCNIIPKLISKGKENYVDKILNGSFNKMEKVELNVACSKGWFNLENYFQSSEKMNKAITIAIEIDDFSDKSDAYQKIVEEFINQEKWNAAVEFLDRISTKQNQLEVAKNLGEQVAEKYEENEVQLLNNEFSSPTLRNAFWKGIINQIKPVFIDRKMFLHNLKSNNWETATFINLIEIDTVKQILLNQIEPDFKPQLISRLNLQWAIDIKNKTNLIQ